LNGSGLIFESQSYRPIGSQAGPTLRATEKSGNEINSLTVRAYPRTLWEGASGREIVSNVSNKKVLGRALSVMVNRYRVRTAGQARQWYPVLAEQKSSIYGKQEIVVAGIGAPGEIGAMAKMGASCSHPQLDSMNSLQPTDQLKESKFP